MTGFSSDATRPAEAPGKGGFWTSGRGGRVATVANAMIRRATRSAGSLDQVMQAPRG